jgi:hypothetical protein
LSLPTGGKKERKTGKKRKEERKGKRKEERRWNRGKTVRRGTEENDRQVCLSSLFPDSF